MGRGDSRSTLKMKRRKAQTSMKERIARRKEDKQAQPKAKTTASTVAAKPSATGAKVRKKPTA